MFYLTRRLSLPDLSPTEPSFPLPHFCFRPLRSTSLPHPSLLSLSHGTTPVGAIVSRRNRGDPELESADLLPEHGNTRPVGFESPQLVRSSRLTEKREGTPTTCRSRPQRPPGEGPLGFETETRLTARRLSRFHSSPTLGTGILSVGRVLSVDRVLSDGPSYLPSKESRLRSRVPHDLCSEED